MASESLTQLLTRNDSMSERTRTRNQQAVVIRFTSKSLEDLKPRPHPSRFIAWDKDHCGFGVRITPQGTKPFVYVYRFDGTSRLLSIGNTPPLTLEEARSAFAEAQAKLMRAKHQRRHEGIAPREELDPAAARIKRRQERNRCPTCDDLFALYERKNAAALRPKTSYENARMWRLHVKPVLGGVKAGDVHPHTVKRLLDDIHDNSGPAMANRVHGFNAMLFNLGRRELLIEFENPTRRVRAPGKEAPRERALHDAEIRGLFTCCQRQPCRSAYGLSCSSCWAPWRGMCDALAGHRRGCADLDRAGRNREDKKATLWAPLPARPRADRGVQATALPRGLDRPP